MEGLIVCLTPIQSFEGADMHVVDTGINTVLDALYRIPRIPDRTLFASNIKGNGIVTKHWSPGMIRRRLH
jgi:hypothetical protein